MGGQGQSLGHRGTLGLCHREPTMQKVVDESVGWGMPAQVRTPALPHPALRSCESRLPSLGSLVPWGASQE